MRKIDYIRKILRIAMRCENTWVLNQIYMFAINMTMESGVAGHE